jgi:saccharopine dehydrogenase (NAD+, L-lysine-forming)
VFNVEQLPSKPFLEELARQGLPWHVQKMAADEQRELFAI